MNFVNRSTALWFSMKPFCSENKKKAKLPRFWKNYIFHIYIIWIIHINHLKSHASKLIGSVQCRFKYGEKSVFCLKWGISFNDHNYKMSTGRHMSKFEQSNLFYPSVPYCEVTHCRKILLYDAVWNFAANILLEWGADNY